MELAVAWYEAQRVGLGIEFIHALDVAPSQLAERPTSFRIVRPGIRRALLGRFPYGVFFADDDRSVTALAVVHASRHRDVDHPDPHANECWNCQGIAIECLRLSPQTLIRILCSSTCGVIPQQSLMFNPADLESTQMTYGRHRDALARSDMASCFYWAAMFNSNGTTWT